MVNQIRNEGCFVAKICTAILPGIPTDPGFGDLIAGFVGLEPNLENAAPCPAPMKIEPALFKENKPAVVHALGYESVLDFCKLHLC